MGCIMYRKTFVNKSYGPIIRWEIIHYRTTYTLGVQHGFFRRCEPRPEDVR